MRVRNASLVAGLRIFYSKQLRVAKGESIAAGLSMWTKVIYCGAHR